MKPTPDNETPDGMPRFGFLEIAVLVLSVYVLGALLAPVFHVPPEVSLLIDRIDTCLPYRSVEDGRPVALITHPRRIMLATHAAHIVTGSGSASRRRISALAVCQRV